MRKQILSDHAWYLSFSGPTTVTSILSTSQTSESGGKKPRMSFCGIDPAFSTRNGSIRNSFRDIHQLQRRMPKRTHLTIMISLLYYMKRHRSQLRKFGRYIRQLAEVSSHFERVSLSATKIFPPQTPQHVDMNGAPTRPNATPRDKWDPHRYLLQKFNDVGMFRLGNPTWGDGVVGEDWTERLHYQPMGRGAPRIEDSGMMAGVEGLNILMIDQMAQTYARSR